MQSCISKKIKRKSEQKEGKNVFEMKMIAILCHKTVKLALKISLEIKAVY